MKFVAALNQAAINQNTWWWYLRVMPPRTTGQQWCDMSNKTDSSEESRKGCLEKGSATKKP